mmetsp:Transcript_37698/g.56943  ORF Transcript_37698/g.56943 Transcript_37698/m.56943 type:complete len:356 (-) Transcript_37698:458-1525(-)
MQRNPFFFSLHSFGPLGKAGEEGILASTGSLSASVGHGAEVAVEQALGIAGAGLGAEGVHHLALDLRRQNLQRGRAGLVETPGLDEQADLLWHGRLARARWDEALRRCCWRNRSEHAATVLHLDGLDEAVEESVHIVGVCLRAEVAHDLSLDRGVQRQHRVEGALIQAPSLAEGVDPAGVHGATIWWHASRDGDLVRGLVHGALAALAAARLHHRLEEAVEEPVNVSCSWSGSELCKHSCLGVRWQLSELLMRKLVETPLSGEGLYGREVALGEASSCGGRSPNAALSCSRGEVGRPDDGRPSLAVAGSEAVGACSCSWVLEGLQEAVEEAVRIAGAGLGLELCEHAHLGVTREP